MPLLFSHGTLQQQDVQRSTFGRLLQGQKDELLGIEQSLVRIEGEGNTVTRLYFMRLRRLTQEASRVGELTPELQKARAENAPTFTHFLDLPILFLIGNRSDR